MCITCRPPVIEHIEVQLVRRPVDAQGRNHSLLHHLRTDTDTLTHKSDTDARNAHVKTSTIGYSHTLTSTINNLSIFLSRINILI